MINNAELFVYWFQGYVELNGSRPSEEQWDSIKDHLALVFKKVTKPLVSIDPKSGGMSYCSLNVKDFSAKDFFKDFTPTGHPPFSIKMNFPEKDVVNKNGDSMDFKNVHGKDIIEHSC